VASPEAEAFSVRLAGLLATVAAALTAARRGRRPSQKPAVRAQAVEHQGTAKSATEDVEVMRRRLQTAWRAAAQAPDPTVPEHAEPGLRTDAELGRRPRPAEIPPHDVLEGLAACVLEGLAACAGRLPPLARLAAGGALLAELCRLAGAGAHLDAQHCSSVLSLVLCMRLLRKDGGR